MKQIIKSYTLLVVSCLLLAGCSNDEDVGGELTPVAVQFGIGSIAQTKTTSGGNQWSLNDPIGIFMLKNGQPLNSSNIVESADNVEYKAQTGGNAVSGFTSASGTPIFYPLNGDNVDFIAYYPYKSPLNNYTYPVDVSSQATPANIDVLYANTNPTLGGSGYNKNSSTVDLQFNHVLSKLSFTLTSGDGSPSLTGAKIEITNLASTANISLANGIVTATSSGQTLTANTANDGLSSSAIVIPQTLSGTKLIITLADNVSKFEWTFTDSEFLGGKNHQYAITVNKTGITVSSSGITIWTGTSDPATPGTAKKGYKVGDYYPDPNAVYQNGTLISGTAAIGLVFWLDNQSVGDHPYNKVSQHGKIVGLYERADGFLDASCMGWVTDYGTTYNAGTGWYMPAYGDNDYDLLYCAYNGMNYETWSIDKPNDISKNHTKRAWFRKKITDAGGDNITDSWYWVSSVNWMNNAHRLHFNSGNIQLSGNDQSSNKLRAIKAF